MNSLTRKLNVRIHEKISQRQDKLAASTLEGLHETFIYEPMNVTHNETQGQVIGFFDSWPVDRTYAVDMAGFAVNMHLLYRYPEANFIYVAGYEEDVFLRSLQLKLADIEVKAANCTQVSISFIALMGYGGRHCFHFQMKSR